MANRWEEQPRDALGRFTPEQPQARTRWIRLRATEDEFRSIYSAAEAEGVSVTKFIVSRCASAQHVVQKD